MFWFRLVFMRCIHTCVGFTKSQNFTTIQQWFLFSVINNQQLMRSTSMKLCRAFCYLIPFPVCKTTISIDSIPLGILIGRMFSTFPHFNYLINDINGFYILYQVFPSSKIYQTGLMRFHHFIHFFFRSIFLLLMCRVLSTNIHSHFQEVRFISCHKSLSSMLNHSFKCS